MLAGWVAACELHALGASWLPVGPEKWLHLVVMGAGAGLCLARAALRRQEHTVAGERIISSVAALADVGPIVRSSHERWDGLGYPDGLAGDQIPRGARIISVCDSYHAMTATVRTARQ